MIKPVTTTTRPALAIGHGPPHIPPSARVRNWRRAFLTAIAAVLLLFSAAACGSGNAGDTAPDFTLPSAFGSSVSLSRVLSEYDSAVLVFYRGSF